MALRKPADTAADTATQAGAFETDDTETTATTTASPAAETVAATPTAKVEGTTAVVQKANSALGLFSGGGTLLKSLQNQIAQSDLESMSIGTFPRITVGLDGFSIDQDKDLGKVVKIEVLSWNYVWLAVTGEQNNKEADKLIRTSYDGKSIKNGGGDLAAYLQHLKNEGYAKADVKQYIEVYAQLLWSEDKGDVDPDAQQIHQLSLAPTSAAQWGRYLLESGVRKARGIPDSNVVFAKQEKKVNGSTKWGVATFSPKNPTAA